MKSPTTTSAVTTAAGDDGELGGLSLLITIAVCSVAGAILFILCTVLIILLAIISRTRGRKRIRDYSVAVGMDSKNQQSTKHKTNKLETEGGLINNNAPPIPPHITKDQQLQVISPLPKNSLTSANFRETPTSSASGAMNSTSTDITVVVDVEDSIVEEPVFPENETKSSIQAINNPLLNQHSRNCVPTYDNGSHRCRNGDTDEHAMNLISYRKNVDSIKAKGCWSSDVIERSKPESDSLNYVNITTVGRQALEHTNEQSNATQFSLLQPGLREHNLSHTSDDHSHGYVNFPTLSTSSQPLLNDRCSDCGPGHLNCTQHCGYANVTGSSPSSFECQASAPVYTTHADKPCSTSHCGPALKVPPSQLCSLPPKTQRTTTLVGYYEPSQEPSHNHFNESVYVNISSQSSLSKQTTIPTRTAVLGSYSYSVESSKACSQADNPGYVNVTKLRSLSQPNMATVDAVTSSVHLLPPRTILRANYRKPTANDEKLGIHPLSSRQPCSKTTQHMHQLPLSSPDQKKSPPLSCNLLPAEDIQHTKFTEIESKSSAGCSSGSSCQLDKSNQTGTHVQVNDNKSLNDLSGYSNNTPKDRHCSSDLEDTDYVIDKLESCEISESMDSLDLWPPVIPQHTELMFIMVDNQESQEEFGDERNDHNDHNDHTDTDVKMITNKSYVKH